MSLTLLEFLLISFDFLRVPFKPCIGQGPCRIAVHIQKIQSMQMALGAALALAFKAALALEPALALEAALAL